MFALALVSKRVYAFCHDMKSATLFLAGSLLIPCHSALAWSGPGHELIAAEAFRELSPGLKTKVTDILMAHPDYARWTNSFQPGGLDLPTFIFMRSATWPDEIRRTTGPNSIYDHPNWHYVDWALRPPNFPMETEPSPTNNVIYGIEQLEKTLSDSNTVPELKAASLSWLIHLVGDVHQPLHCSSLFNDTYPEGDRGGNEFYVKPADRVVRLHSLWDGLLGTRIHPQTQFNDAVRIDAQYSRSSLPELTKDTTPKSWSLESRQLAIDKGYLGGKLNGSTSSETAPPLPEGYTTTAKEVAEKQAALAGYRLADEIRQYVK